MFSSILLQVFFWLLKKFLLIFLFLFCSILFLLCSLFLSLFCLLLSLSFSLHFSLALTFLVFSISPLLSLSSYCSSALSLYICLVTHCSPAFSLSFTLSFFPLLFYVFLHFLVSPSLSPFIYLSSSDSPNFLTLFSFDFFLSVTLIFHFLTLSLFFLLLILSLHFLCCLIVNPFSLFHQLFMICFPLFLLHFSLSLYNSYPFPILLYISNDCHISVGQIYFCEFSKLWNWLVKSKSNYWDISKQQIELKFKFCIVFHHCYYYNLNCHSLFRSSLFLANLLLLLFPFSLILFSPNCSYFSNSLNL